VEPLSSIPLRWRIRFQTPARISQMDATNQLLKKQSFGDLFNDFDGRAFDAAVARGR
jgi:hypothetical protein